MWINLEAEPGRDIAEEAQQAIRVSVILGMTVWFKANGVSIRADSQRTVSEIVWAYQRALVEGRQIA